jgi:trans-2,3-dihydro-3-hydroxyanthranilate isomerase
MAARVDPRSILQRAGASLEWWVSFADGPNGGNPAPIVVSADQLDTSQMQDVAAGLGFETAFVLQAEEEGVCRLRFFVPRHEVEMCGHATIAVLTMLAQVGGFPSEGVFGTQTRLRSFVRRHDDRTMIELDAPHPAGSVPNIDELADVLRVDPASVGGDLGSPATVSVARPKTIVPLVDERTLDDLRPNHRRLWELCERASSTGIYAVAPSTRDGCDFAARQFPLRVGFVEDPATGIAAGALAAELHRRGIEPLPDAAGVYRIAQGRAMGRPSLILAQPPRRDDDHVWIGGRARRASIPQPLT